MKLWRERWQTELNYKLKLPRICSVFTPGRRSNSAPLPNSSAPSSGHLGGLPSFTTKGSWMHLGERCQASCQSIIPVWIKVRSTNRRQTCCHSWHSQSSHTLQSGPTSDRSHHDVEYVYPQQCTPPSLHLLPATAPCRNWHTNNTHRNYTKTHMNYAMHMTAACFPCYTWIRLGPL